MSNRLVIGVRGRIQPRMSGLQIKLSTNFTFTAENPYNSPLYSMPSDEFNHYRTTGRCSGPAHYDVSIRQAARAAFVTSSFKIFLPQTFPRCGATCYILPSRAMTQLFNGVNFVYRSVEVYLTFCSYLRVLVRIQCFYNGGRY